MAGPGPLNGMASEHAVFQLDARKQRTPHAEGSFQQRRCMDAV